MRTSQSASHSKLFKLGAMMASAAEQNQNGLRSEVVNPVTSRSNNAIQITEGDQSKAGSPMSIDQKKKSSFLEV